MRSSFVLCFIALSASLCYSQQEDSLKLKRKDGFQEALERQQRNVENSLRDAKKKYPQRSFRLSVPPKSIVCYAFVRYDSKGNLNPKYGNVEYWPGTTSFDFSYFWAKKKVETPPGHFRFHCKISNKYRKCLTEGHYAPMVKVKPDLKFLPLQFHSSCEYLSDSDITLFKYPLFRATGQEAFLEFYLADDIAKMKKYLLKKSTLMHASFLRQLSFHSDNKKTEIK